MEISLPISGDRFIIREFKSADATALADIEYDIEVKKFLKVPDKSKADWAKDVEVRGLNSDHWVIQMEDERVAGRIGFIEKREWGRGNAEINVVIGRPFWGQALGTKVTELAVQLGFNQLQLNAIFAIIHPGNKGSLRIVDRLGFCCISTVTEESWQMGHSIYKLTRDEYLQRLNMTR